MAEGSVIKDKGVSKWLWWIPALLVVIGLSTAIGVSASKRAVASTGYYPYEYKLAKNQQVYTKVKVGQGTNLQLWASKPFYVVAGQSDGTTTEYWMPDGKSSWIGADPAGPFVIKGETDGTIVRIK